MYAERPGHVPAELVVDFDIYNLPGAADDVQLAYRAFQQNCPDIFWTPANGGHWVATRAEDVEAMQRDHARFSHRRITIPAMPPEAPRQIPLEVDPPEHAAYRKPLMQALLPGVVHALEGKIRAVTIELIEGFRSRGQCDFVEDFAKVLPIVVFLDLVDLPREDRAFLLPLAEDAVRGTTVEIRGRAHGAVADYLQQWIVARREAPGTDLLSTIVNADIGGERISHAEATSFATLVLFGGLDTVASMLGFIARFLATHPAHRRQIIDRLGDDAFMKIVIEELLRRHGVTNTARYIAQDFDYKGLAFRSGDMMLPLAMMVGLDERKVRDPLTVDFSRPFPIPQGTFGSGAHTCPGAVLARREIRIFLEEWLSRIPDFAIRDGSRPVQATGLVNGVLELQLVWPSL
jgi:cytochrome P450